MEENANARYSDIDLQEFKELIQEKLKNAKTEFEFMGNQISELNGSNGDREGGDFMDDSNKQVEIELLSNMMFRQKLFIRSLENALLRIKNKSYGVCSVTGQLINKNRLKLVPHATKSIAGKNSEQLKTRPAFEKRQIKNTGKPKLISKIIRKNLPNNTKNESDLFEWENDEVDGIEEFDGNVAE